MQKIDKTEATKKRVGAIRYEAFYDDEDNTITFFEYVFRSFRRDTGYMVERCPVTWGKLSKKIGDYGFRQNIPHYCRKSFPLCAGLPYSATKLGAVKQCLAVERKNYKTTHAKDYEYHRRDKEDYDKAVKKLNAAIKRERTRAGKGKQ